MHTSEGHGRPLLSAFEIRIGPSMTTPTLHSANRQRGDDIAKWIVVGVLAFAALVAFSIARQITNPLVGIATQQACSAHGEELSRPVTGYERARTFTLLNRTDGTCSYGPVTEVVGEGNVVVADDVAPQLADPGPEILDVSLSDLEAGGLYRAVTLMAIVLQLGFASIVVRLLADPLLDRFVR